MLILVEQEKAGKSGHISVWPEAPLSMKHDHGNFHDSNMDISFI